MSTFIENDKFHRRNVNFDRKRQIFRNKRQILCFTVCQLKEIDQRTIVELFRYDFLHLFFFFADSFRTIDWQR